MQNYACTVNRSLEVKSMKAQLSPAEEPDLDRRNFLKGSCAAVLAAAVTLPAASVAPATPGLAAPSGKPNLYGRWFAV